MSHCNASVEFHVPGQLRGILRKYAHLVTLHGYKNLCALMQSMNLNQFAHRMEGEVHRTMLAGAGTTCTLNSRTCPSREDVAAYVGCLKRSWPKDVGPDARTRNVFASLLHDCLVLYFRVYCGGKDGKVADKANLVRFLEYMRTYFCSYTPCGRGASAEDIGEEEVAFVDDENDEEIYQGTGPSPFGSVPSVAPSPGPHKSKDFLSAHGQTIAIACCVLSVLLFLFWFVTRDPYA
jgi:hypothetical protein